MKYSLFSGGKRLRPIFVLEFCRMCCGDLDLAKEFCIAVEMVHTYSLIHDDLPCMDNDDFRRGNPSCHVKFGEDIALLAGDALLSHAFNVISKSKLPSNIIVKVLSLLSSNIGVNGMVGGQELDLKSQKGNLKSNFDPSLIHNFKTAKLIEACCGIGVLSSPDHYSFENYDHSIVYGLNIGLAFQIMDDILDVNGDFFKLGKPLGSDKNKITAVDFYGLDESVNIAKIYTNKAKNALNKFKDNRFLLELSESLLIREK